jgi:hypothetical protein
MTRLPFAAGWLFASLIAPAAATPLHAVCTLDRPLTGYSQHVVVTALTDAPAGTPLQVTWSADGGTLSQGSVPASAVWTPTSQARAVFTIQASIVAPGEAADCTTRIAVIDGVTRGGNTALVSTRSLLMPAAHEATGYGLYSYILFTERPVDQDRGLFESILQSYLAVLHDQERLEAEFPEDFPKSKLNVAYVPIGRPLPDDFDQRDDQVAWLRNHYDYDRAFAFLTRLRTLPQADAVLLGGTAWLVSCLHPLSGREDPSPVLPQDLSAVPARLIPDLMRSFASQTTQPRDYNPHAMFRLRLDLRIAIGQLADGLKPVAAAFKILGASGAEE